MSPKSDDVLSGHSFGIYAKCFEMVSLWALISPSVPQPTVLEVLILSEDDCCSEPTNGKGNLGILRLIPLPLNK